jgi:DNA-binding CsgD family transcriptional regulator
MIEKYRQPRSDVAGSDHASFDGGIRVAIGVLAAAAVLVGTDLLLDDKAGADLPHLVVEATLMLVSAGTALWLWWGRRRARAEVRGLERDVDAARAEAERWRGEAAELLEGLGVSISRQFRRWKLTEAEREVALLLLKGLSHREAAAVRGVSERTVRQQAREVYRKAGLAGRSELSAFFLEDLLLPPEPPGAPRT